MGAKDRRAEGQAHGNLRSTPAIRPVSRPRLVVMMRGLRFRGARVRGGNLTLAVAILAVLMLASGKAAVMQDLLTVILIALSLLTAGILALFVLQVRMARREAVHPVRARAVPAPRPAPAARSLPPPAAPARAQARHARAGPGDESPRLSHANVMPR
jgi:hypothetical protein